MNRLKQASENLTNSHLEGRHRYSFKQELILAALPTITVLLVLVMLESFARQRLLFASLASSAFLIYRDPHNEMNSLYSLLISQMGGAIIGFAGSFIFGEGYQAAAIAMLVTIVYMILLDAIHPPAISTAISFSFRAPGTNTFLLFLMALIMVAVLVLLEQAILWLTRRFDK
ncbi:MAG TPA: HPP family protein [Chloroflexia bacterium]|nr:HPP family protein [Chloroflexia bacterium]